MRRFFSIMVFIAVLLPIAGRQAFAQTGGQIAPVGIGTTPPILTNPPDIAPLAPPSRLPVIPDGGQPINRPDMPMVRPGGTLGDKSPTPAILAPGAAVAPPAETAYPASSVTPSLAVEFIGPEMANIALPIPYDLIVRNVGKCAAINVRVEAELPAGFSYLGGEPKADVPGGRMSWSLGTMESGAERRIKLVVKSMSEGELRPKATVSFSSACSLTTKFTRPKLSVSLTGPEFAMVGETVSFQIRISNAGTGPIQKVMIRDRLPNGLQHPQGNQIEADLGSLAAGESRTVVLKTTAAKTGIQANEIVAYADSSIAANGIQLAGGPRNPDLESTAKIEVRILEPGLQLRLSGPKTCLVKCEGVFSIDLTNPGSAPSHNIRVVNRLPEGVEFLAASDDGTYEPTTRTVSWVFATQEPGAHKVVTIKTRGIAIGESADVVLAQADGGLNAKAEMPVAIEGIPAISLEVANTDDPAPVGSDVMYEIRIVNRGSCPCTGIQIVAVMPDGMEVREVAAPAPYKVVGQQVQFTSYARLATKADLLYRIKVRSNKPGDVRFKVQLTCDQLQQPVNKEESSRFYKP